MEKSMGRWGAILFVAILVICCFTKFLTAQTIVTQDKVKEMVQNFIQTNQSKMTFLQEAHFGVPQLIRDLKSGELNWRVEIKKNDKHMGFFYATSQSLKDGNIPMWFAGPGESEGKVVSKFPGEVQQKVAPADQIGVVSGDKQSKKLQQAIRQYEQRHQLLPGEEIPKGSHRPLKVSVSLIFDPSQNRKVIPQKDVNKKEIIPDNPPQSPTGWQTIKSETFEGSFPNDWDVFVSSGYTDAYWDDTSYKKHNGSWGCFCADLGADGTGYGGQYVNNMYAWMVYGPFSLADANDAVVEFWHWTKTESNYDKLHYVASTNGTNYYGYYLTGDMTDDTGNVNGWLHQTFDLKNVYSIGDLTGESQVWIAFVFTSDGSIIDDGAYLDDIVIKKNVSDGTPTLTDHFTCRDGDDPYNTQTTTFYTTDAIATEFVKWNSTSATSSHASDIKFYDTSNAYYWGASYSIPAGQSAYTFWAGIYISGYTPANEPGQWKAKVFLDGSVVATDNFTIQQQGGEPQVNEHFMCRDGNQPYSTQTDTFYVTDNLATVFMQWNTSSATRDWTANCSFFDTNDDYYAGADINLTMGQSALNTWVGMYISGHQPANDPGAWKARVRLEGTFMFREDFWILQQQQQDPVINVTPTALEIHQIPGRSTDSREYLPPQDYEPPDGIYPRGLKIPEHVKDYWKTHQPTFDYDPNQLLSSVDWSGNDSPVKSQLNCGSCWAFAAIALIENLGVWNDLSEQELVSCAPGDCNGGWYWDALEYIHNQGVAPEACYPYTATNGNCANKCNSPQYLAKVTNYTPAQGLWGEPANVNDIKAQLQNGPLAVAMLVPTDGTFDNYTGGVYNYSGGSISWDNGHAVLVVGYDDNGQYFLAKNSWGTNWGDNGYFKIAYDDVTDDVHFGMYACTASGVYQEGGNSGNTFVISNVGGANLIVSSISDDKSWLSFTPTTIPTLAPGASQTVTVNVSNWSSINCPSEIGTITIQSNDPATPTSQVSVTAYPDCNNPVLVVNPSNLTFSSNQGSNPPSQTFAISNGGNGSFNWSVSDNKSWITCNPTGGSTTSETDNVTVSINASGLNPGNYSGQITVSAPGAAGSPKIVNVTFNYGGGGPCNPPYVKAKDATGAQGSDVVIDIKMAQNPTPVDAFGLQFTFNSSKMSFVSVAKGNLTNGFDFFNGQEGPAGTVTIGGFNTAAIPANSTGVIAKVTLHVNQCTQGETMSLGIQNLTDDLSSMNACSGTFTCQACLLGDVNDDGTISPGDALCAFQIYLNGGNLPSGDCNNECALYAADINCTPNGITPGDALYIFQGYLNGDSAPLDCDPTFVLQNVSPQNREISVFQLPSDNVDEIKVAVRVNEAQGLQAFGLNLGFPDDLLQLVEVKSTNLTRVWESFGGKESMTGVVTLGGYHSEIVQQSSPALLAELTFRILREANAAELWIFNLVDDLKSAKLSAESINIPLVTTDVRKIDAGNIPQQFSLSQNYPNPFNMETDINYELSEAVHVTLTIYNAMGQKIRTLVAQKQDAGRYEAHWDGKDAAGNDLPSGIYVYKLHTSKFVDAKKLILVK